MLDDLLAWIDRAVAGGRAALGLRAPAPASALDAYERELGVALPAELRALWLRHDGQDQRDDEVGWLPERWLSVAESRTLRDTWMNHVVLEWLDRPLERDPRLRDLVYHPRRVPWLSSYLDDHFVVVDLAPGPAGTVGQVIVNVSECDFEILGTSPGDFLDRYAALARAGALAYDPAVASWPTVSGTCLWDVLALR